MRVDHFQNTLRLLTLLGAGVGAHASTSNTTVHSPECIIQAWVRAPDLAPGTIIQGDTRLKLTAGCAAVESASLGLRFKERSFIKASRSVEAVKRPTKEKNWFDIFDLDSERMSPSSPWVLSVRDTVDWNHHMIFEEFVKNKDLWLVREEERISMDMGDAQPGTVRDVVRDFAILVPSTNFPPALDYPNSQVGTREAEFVNVETMYEYFVRVAFTNGTTAETSAGFTAFQPLYDPPNVNLAPFNIVQLQTWESLDRSLVDGDPVANYSAHIISQHDGFAFTQGSDDQFIKVAIARTGRARTFAKPLTLNLCIDSNISPKWVPEYTSDPTLQPLHKPNQILRATSDDFRTRMLQSSTRCNYVNHGRTSPKHISMPNPTPEQIAAGEIVTTISKPVQVFVDPDPRCSTDFEAYYQTLRNKLFLSLEVPRTRNEPLEPSDLLQFTRSQKRMPAFEADEEAWVPWEKDPGVKAASRSMRKYEGDISISVYPATETQLPKHCVCARGAPAEGSEQAQVVMTSSEQPPSDCAMRSPVHYLTKGARAPIFMNGSATNIRELLAKTAAERDLLAPFLEPAVSSPPEGEELVHRYYRVPEGQRPLIYVGETWVKKVAYEDEQKQTPPRRQGSISDVVAEAAQVWKHMVDEF